MNLSLPLSPSPSSLSLLKQSHYLLMTGQSTCSACPGLPADLPAPSPAPRPPSAPRPGGGALPAALGEISAVMAFKWIHIFTISNGLRCFLVTLTTNGNNKR